MAESLYDSVSESFGRNVETKGFSIFQRGEQVYISIDGRTSRLKVCRTPGRETHVNVTQETTATRFGIDNTVVRSIPVSRLARFAVNTFYT